jgi:hypothetical protein
MQFSTVTISESFNIKNQQKWEILKKVGDKMARIYYIDLLEFSSIYS